MDFKFVKAGTSGAPKETKKEEPKLDVNAIPNIDKLLETVLEFLQYINTDEMQQLERDDEYAFEYHMNSKFEDFSLQHYSIFRLLMDKKNREDNICKLIDMFNILKRVKKGELELEKANKDFQEDLNNEFIYPKFGGKENFEKTLKNKKNKNKSKK